MSAMKEQWRRFLQDAQAVILEEAQKAVEGNAKQFLRMAKRAAPKRSGRLRRSIVLTRGGHSTPAYSRGGRRLVPDGAYSVTSGNEKVRYAHLVEFGTRRTRKQPYFWRTLKQLRQNFRRRNRAALRRAIKRGNA